MDRISPKLLENALELMQSQGKLPSRKQLMDTFGISESLARKLYGILEHLDLLVSERYLIKVPSPAGKLRVGAISDLHVGSKSCFEEQLVEYLKVANNRTDVLLIAGDLIDGFGVYKGQQFELLYPSVEDQVARLIEILEVYEKPIYFITGNHEDAVYKATGIDVGNMIKGKNRIYLGSHLASTKINNIKIDLWHGRGASAYALSYKLQKMIEQYLSGKKPHIVFSGHWHRAFHMPVYRNIDGFECGTFQGETRLTRQMGVFPQIGGWFLNIEYAEDGTPITIGGEFWRVYV